LRPGQEGGGQVARCFGPHFPRFIIESCGSSEPSNEL
jgi:hypothetical protein